MKMKQSKEQRLQHQVNKLEKDLEYSRECLGTRDKYWSKIMVERNSYLLETGRLKDGLKDLELKLQQKEKDYYFNIRNTTHWGLVKIYCTFFLEQYIDWHCYNTIHCFFVSLVSIIRLQ